MSEQNLYLSDMEHSQRKVFLPGNPVQIVGVKESNVAGNENAFHLKLNTQVLRDILGKTRDFPIGVCSVAGPARTGKSFMLSYLVRYLQALEQSQDENVGDWLDKQNPNLPMIEKGFEFGNSLDRATEGIWMWSRPFIIQPSGSSTPIAILLMDSEGCFDAFTSERVQSSIVGLTLLLSSCFIFNESSRLDESTLTTLVNCMQYGQIASGSYDGKAFQRLMFLIRDWNQPTLFDFGAAGGEAFIRKYLQVRPGMPPVAQKKRKSIEENFDHYNAYLMPHPGMQVLNKNFCGSVGELSLDFQDHLANFIPNLVADFEPKKFANQFAVRHSFFQAFCKYVDAFNEPEIPSPACILNATVHAAFEAQVKAFVHQYNQAFQSEVASKSIQETSSCFPGDQLEKIHNKVKLSIVEKFKNKRHPGSERDTEIFSRKLSEELECAFQNWVAEFNKVQQQALDEFVENGLHRFDDNIRQNILRSHEVWCEPEFLATTAPMEDQLTQDFIRHVSKLPEEYVQKQLHAFANKLAEKKQMHWVVLAKATAKAEQRVHEIAEKCRIMYAESMQFLLPEEGPLDEKAIRKLHQRSIKKPEVEFGQLVSAEFKDPNFVEKSQSRFSNALQQDFDLFNAANNDKLKPKIDILDQDLLEMKEAFTDRTYTIVKNPTHSFREDLTNEYDLIYDNAIETLEQGDFLEGLPLTEKEYRRKIKEELDTMLEVAISAAAQTLELKNKQSDEMWQDSLKSLQNNVEALLRTQSMFDPVSLEAKLANLISNQVVHLESCAKELSINCDQFLTQLKEQAINLKERVFRENAEKIRSFHSDIMSKLHDLRRNYCQRMKQEMQNCDSEDEYCSMNSFVTNELVDKLRTEPPLCNNPHSSGKWVEKLRDEIATEFAALQTVFSGQLTKRKEFEEKGIQSTVQHFKDFVEKTIRDDPFVQEDELDVSIQTKLSLTSREFNLQTSELFPKDTQARMTEAFKQQLEEVRKSLPYVASSIKGDVCRQLEELEDSCISFALHKPEFKELVEKFTVDLQEDLVSATKDRFEKLWQFAFSGVRRAETWASVERKVRDRYQKELERIQTKHMEEGEIVEKITGSILMNFCTDWELKLNSGIILPEDDLESTVSDAEAKARATFLEKLDDKDIPSASRLEEFNDQLKERWEMLLEKNKQNKEEAFIHANNILDKEFEEAARSCKTQDELEFLHEKTNSKSLDFLRTKFHPEISDDEIAHLMNDFTLRSQQMFETSLLSRKPTDEDERELLEELVPKAVRIYNDYMKTALEGFHPHTAMNPVNLKENDNICLRATLKKLIQGTDFLTKQMKLALEKRLKESYKIYVDKNNLIQAQEDNLAVGIDLGTTTTCVAIYQHGGVQVIPNNSGHKLTPSYVFYHNDGSVTIGKEAKDQSRLHPEQVIFDSKRLIGRRFHDPLVQNDMLNWPFTVKKGKDGRSLICVNKNDYTPAQISAHVLAHMKDIATKHLGHSVKKAVITVPANFKDGERDATRQAAEIAGLEVLQIINEPTAAAMAYALSWNDEDKTVLVFDFGGGTFDVTILQAESMLPEEKTETSQDGLAVVTSKASAVAAQTSCTTMQVLTTMGDTHLGGEDIDQSLVDHCIEEFRKQTGYNLREVHTGSAAMKKANLNKLIARLRHACESAKEILSSAPETQICVDSVHQNYDLSVTITRAEFEDINEELFAKTIAIVKRAMADAGLDKTDITDVLMVGGSSRIPKVREMLEEYLEMSVQINQMVDIQEAVARGAAVQACILNGGAAVNNLPVIKDIQPFSLGIELKDGDMSIITHRNTPIPCEAFQLYCTTIDDQAEVGIRIYAGEDTGRACNNVLLGNFTLYNIPPGPKGSQEICVQMKIDGSGILQVEATCSSTGGKQQLEIKEVRGRISEEDILEMKLKLRSNN